jgi:perosamine synthetase
MKPAPPVMVYLPDFGEKFGEKYHELFKGINSIGMQKKMPDSDPCYWLNIVLMRDKSEKEVHEIGNKMMDKGIGIRPAFWPLDKEDAFKRYACTDGRNAQYIFERGLVLPSATSLADNLESISDIAREFWRSYGK